MKKEGFSLIELMVVIAIIGILSSILIPNVGQMMAKARDATRRAEFSSVSVALYSFHSDNNRMPNNYNPCCGACEGQSYYDSSMNELVNGGYLKEIPRSPGGSSYCYYNYGGGNNTGAIMVTGLETYSGTTGLKGSCRPWAPGVNWCSQSDNCYYCVCNPY